MIMPKNYCKLIIIGELFYLAFIKIAHHASTPLGGHWPEVLCFQVGTVRPSVTKFVEAISPVEGFQQNFTQAFSTRHR